LLATPGGVCSAHDADPVDRVKTSQKVLAGSSRWPMAIRTVDPDGVVDDAVSGRVAAGRVAALWAAAEAGAALPAMTMPSSAMATAIALPPILNA
jgi:hypothetical protein